MGPGSKWSAPGEPAAGLGRESCGRCGRGSGKPAPVDYLLLTDADIAHRPGSLRALVRAAVRHRLDLVSQMARLRVQTGWERLVVPAFVYFFAMLFPFRWMQRAGCPHGGRGRWLFLVRRAALVRGRGPGRDPRRGDRRRRAGAAPEARRLADVPRAGADPGVGPAVPDGLADLWRMVARSAYAQLRHSPLLLTGTVVGLALVFVVPPAAAIAGAVAGARGRCSRARRPGC